MHLHNHQRPLSSSSIGLRSSVSSASEEASPRGEHLESDPPLSLSQCARSSLLRRFWGENVSTAIPGTCRFSLLWAPWDAACSALLDLGLEEHVEGPCAPAAHRPDGGTSFNASPMEDAPTSTAWVPAAPRWRSDDFDHGEIPLPYLLLVAVFRLRPPFWSQWNVSFL